MPWHSTPAAVARRGWTTTATVSSDSSASTSTRVPGARTRIWTSSVRPISTMCCRLTMPASTSSTPNFVVEHLRYPERTFAEWRRRAPARRPARPADEQPRQSAAGGYRMQSPSHCASSSSGVAPAPPSGTCSRPHTCATRPAQLARPQRQQASSRSSVEYVGTLHRYGARLPGAGPVLRGVERLLPRTRRSTMRRELPLSARVLFEVC